MRRFLFIFLMLSILFCTACDKRDYEAEAVQAMKEKYNTEFTAMGSEDDEEFNVKHVWIYPNAYPSLVVTVSIDKSSKDDLRFTDDYQEIIEEREKSLKEITYEENE